MFQKLRGILTYYRAAKTIYKVQSPSAYRFVMDVFDTKSKYYAFQRIEEVREAYLRDRTKIEVVDYGAGPSSGDGRLRSVSSIANSALSSPRQCQNLFRLVNSNPSITILEMGASLGISTAYLAAANPKGRVISLEGDPTIAQIAQQTLSRLGLTTVDLRVGNFDDTLDQALEDLGQIDIAFVDGNHTYEATIRYMNAILPYCHPNSILVFDDIYWSEGMMKAWKDIKARSEVRMTIDDYFQGYVFLKENSDYPQHLTYIPFWAKPWQIGLTQ